MNVMAVGKWLGVRRHCIYNKLFRDSVNSQQNSIIGNESKRLHVSMLLFSSIEYSVALRLV